MKAQSARPVYFISTLRAWTHSPAAPASKAASAIRQKALSSSALRNFWRSLTVTGFSTVAMTARTIATACSGRLIRYPPALRARALRTGQAKFRSTTSKPTLPTTRAAAAIVSGLPPMS